MQKEVKQLIKSYMKVEKEAQDIKDKQIKIAKRIPEIGPQPPKINQNKVKDQVSALKQKRQLLERESQKISQEHDYMQQIIKNELKKQLAPPSQQNDILLNLEKVAQETQLAYLKFRTDKFIQKLNRVFTIKDIKFEFIQKLKLQQKQRGENLTHYIEFRNYSLLRKAFSGWKIELQRNKEQIQSREEQQRQKYEMGQNQLAFEFRNFCLMNRAFKSLRKYVKLNALTKQFNTDQNQIKVKVNTFLNEMQKQIVMSLEKEKEEIEIIKQSNFTGELTISDSQGSEKQQVDDIIENNEMIENEFLYQSNEEALQLTVKPIQQPDILFIKKNSNLEKQNLQVSDQFQDVDEIPVKQQKISQQEEQQPNISLPTKQPQPTKQPINPWKQKPMSSLQCMVDDNEQSIQQQNSSKNVIQQRQKSVDKKNALALELKEKARKRKEMNEIIRKKHEDKKKQQELERLELEQQRQLEIKKRKEEEYNKIQEKKKKEGEMKEKLEQEKFEMQYKTELAIRHYEKQLQKYQIFRPIVKLYEASKYNIEKSINHYEILQKRKLISLLKQAQIRSEELREHEEQIKYNIAYNHFVQTQQKKSLRVLTELRQASIFKQKQALTIRNSYIIRNVLTAWYVQMPEMMAENVKLEKASSRLIEDFRKAMLQKTFFSVWRSVVREITAEKIREQNKQEMWGKVNQWLQEWDEKKIE